MKWAKNLGLINNQQAEQAIARSKFAFNFRFSILNTVSEKLRNLVTDITSWYFYVDDVLDEISQQTKLTTTQVIQIVEVLVDILHEKRQSTKDLPQLSFGDALFGEIYNQVCSATLDIQARIKDVSASYYQIFCQNLAQWLQTVPVEFEIHHQKKLLQEAAYLRLRGYNIGMIPQYDMAAIINSLPNYFQQDHFLCTDRHLGIMLVVMQNDLISLAKELRHTDEDRVNNWVLARYRALRQAKVANPLQLAVNLCVTEYNQEVERWENSIATRNFPDEQATMIAAIYFNGVQSNLDWHVGNERYFCLSN